MKKLGLAGLIVSTFAIFLMVSALVFAVPNASISLVNGTVFNTTTPVISVFCIDNLHPTLTFNVTIFSVNSTNNATNVTILNTNTTTAANGTATFITLTALPAPSEHFIGITCSNASLSLVSPGNLSTNLTSLHFQVNSQSVVDNARATEAFVTRGANVLFTLDFSDNNITYGSVIGGTTAVDGNNMHVCRTDAFLSDNSGCSGETLCSTTTAEADNILQCSYKVTGSEQTGTRTVYMFSVDEDSFTSSSVAVSYKVAGAKGFIDHTTGATDADKLAAGTTGDQAGDGGFNFPLFIGFVVVIAIAVTVLGKKKS